MKTKLTAVELLEKFFNDDTELNRKIFEDFNSREHIGFTADEYFERFNDTFSDFYRSAFDFCLPEWSLDGIEELISSDQYLDFVEILTPKVNTVFTNLFVGSNDLACAA